MSPASTHGLPGSARALLLTVLGEHVFPGREATWTSSLLYVLRGLGVEDQAARQALARCAAAGWIAGERRGRDACWQLTDQGRALVAESIQRVFFSLEDGRLPWDGRWLVVLVPVSRDQRPARRRLYRGLSWAGFGNPIPGVWLTPHGGREPEALKLIASLGLADTTLAFTGNSSSIGMSDEEIVRRAWDLRDAAEHYRVLLERYDRLEPALGDDILFRQLELTSSLGRLPFVDPQLPEELLGDWIGREGLSRLGGLRAAWFPGAHARWQEIVAQTAPPERAK